MRAEVYLDGKLVAYDLIGETPFHVDITREAKPGTEQLLAVRVTNPAVTSTGRTSTYRSGENTTSLLPEASAASSAVSNWKV